jgi:hypothetical protein
MQTSIEQDPELAIGTAKELIETACKTILAHYEVDVEKTWDVPKLMKEAAKRLKLTPDGIADDAPAAATSKRILGWLPW